MLYRSKISVLLFLAFAGLANIRICGQQQVRLPTPVSFFDSIDRRINYLENQIDRLKQTKDVAYLNFQRELDHTLFTKKFQEHILNEDLDIAKELVEVKIEKSEFRKDLSSVQFYLSYQDHIYALIKQQRMHYQQLFKKGNTLRKEYEACIAPGTMTAYQKAQKMISFALKYARENNLTETLKSLETFEAYTKALIFDLESDYDLAELAGNARSFESVFMPLVTSDSLPGLREAERLLSYCVNYGSLSGSSLIGEYFNKKAMMLTSAISDLLDREGREKELARYTDQSVVASYDTLNLCGVFKWHDQIIVIDEFIPASSMENVKKGEAIIHADKMLATYLQKNKLCQSIYDLRFGYAFIIPYKSNAGNTSLYFNKTTQKWQFIACYTMIVSQSYTAEVSKFMPPLFFEDEMNTAQSINQ